MGRCDEGRTIEDCFVALTGTSIRIFNVDRDKILNHRKLELSDLDEVKARPEKNQCIMVTLDLSRKCNS